MTVLPVTPSATSPQEPRRPAAVPAQRFAQSLARAQAPAAVPISEITVRAGDTLSALVGRHLRTVGAQPALNPAQLNQLAVGVAQDNGIANAHWIRPGQVIDVSAVEARAAALSRVGPQLAQAQSAPVPTAPVPTAPVPTAPMAWTAAGVVPGTASNRALGAATGALPGAATGAATGAARSTGSAAGDFLVRHAAAANKTQDASGIPAQFMLAQAALETGWGRREIKAADGRNSFNLFGIRAGANWRGPSVEVMTTEYVNGVPERMVGRFRAYSSYEESFADYARLISQSPRYAQVMQNTSDPMAFASSLQRAGYATGPRYASALASVIEATGRLRATVPQVQLAMAGGMQAPPVFAAASPLPAAQELQLRWSPIAPMPTSALAKAAAARAMQPELYASVDLPAGP